MESRDWMSLGISLLEGLGLGLIYFAGLWWTVQRLTTASQPYLWIGSSFVLRLCLSGLGFYWIMNHQQGSEEQVLSLAMAVTGFLLVRLLLIRSLTPSRPS
ncbi:MAG: ATP synthase subunit I [Synechococcaceae cyanobacterium SM2_3_1]|nr:ATP synthase subunit I [Synechococcaceae cyanobacterium SM2_3_1]